MKYTNEKDRQNIRRLTLIFSLIVLAVLLIVLGLSSVTAFILVEFGILSGEEGIGAWDIVLFMAISPVNNYLNMVIDGNEERGGNGGYRSINVKNINVIRKDLIS